MWPRDEAEKDYAGEAGLDLTEIIGLDGLVASDDVFFAATGVTTGELLDGVRFTSVGAETHTVVMRSRSGTVRFLKASHRFDRLGKMTHAYDAVIDSSQSS